MADFSLHHKTHQPSVDTLKSGDYCSAQFTVDNVWYRARVKKVMPNAEYLIQYMDYGNVEVLPKSRLRSLGSQFTVGQLPPQALELQLAYVNLPSHDEDAEYEGLAALKLLIQNKSLQLQVLAKQGSTITGIVLDKSLSVNEELLRQGHALVKPEVKKALIQWRKTMKPAEILMRQQRKDKNLLADLMESYVDLEDAAKRSRVNIWKYGDFTADE
jgi:staphylococcal nuclease domain-containing protein 1